MERICQPIEIGQQVGLIEIGSARSLFSKNGRHQSWRLDIRLLRETNQAVINPTGMPTTTSVATMLMPINARPQTHPSDIERRHAKPTSSSGSPTPAIRPAAMPISEVTTRGDDIGLNVISEL
jgi:hypothetical protein